MRAAPDAVTVQLQVATSHVATPGEGNFTAWVRAAVAGHGDAAVAGCVTVRLVDADESAALNAGFRGKAAPTNVLAFVAPSPPLPSAELDEPELGDLVICMAVADAEAAEQGKPLTAHLAHLTVHGTLHLLGYDHQNDADAAVMEGLERSVLAGLGLPDPYAGDATEG